MRSSFLFLIMLFAGPMFAQDSWTISLHGRKLMQISVEDETKNVIYLSAASLKKQGSLLVRFSESAPDTAWQRFMGVDSKEETLKESATSLFRLSTAQLRNFFKKDKKLRIYTWALPKDPELRKRVRIRRVHLCTIILRG